MEHHVLVAAPERVDRDRKPLRGKYRGAVGADPPRADDMGPRRAVARDDLRVRRSGTPGIIGRTGCSRSSAWIWLFSSMLRTMARFGGAR